MIIILRYVLATTRMHLNLTPFKRGISIAGIFILVSSLVQAQDSLSNHQNKRITRFMEVGISANSYKGDLNSRYQSWTSAFHAGLKLNFKKRINSHLNLGIGIITGQNYAYTFIGETTEEPTPNSFFKTSFVTANYDLQLNLIRYRNWTVYISQGFGIIRFSPKDVQNQKLLDNLASRAEGEAYNTIAVVLPTQAGLNYIFSNGYGLGVQAGWLNPQTDYLDNISLWGNRLKKDNIVQVKFSLMVPISYH